MLIIGCDYHPSFQQIALVDTETGELQERRLGHREEAEQFYRALATAGAEVRVGMEASGHAGWFERLLAELNFELWMGDAAKIAAKRVRKQKTDRLDAQHILTLMVKDDFPKIWVPSWENRDMRQLLWHRHRMVQTRTRIMNQLQAAALNEGLRYKKKLWRETGRQQLESLPLAPWASRRRRRSVGSLGSHQSDHRRVDASDRAASREMSRGAALDDSSWGGCADSDCFRAHHRESRPLQLRQADRQLSRSGPGGRFQRRATPTGTHQQTGQLLVTVLAGRSGPVHGTQ